MPHVMCSYSSSSAVQTAFDCVSILIRFDVDVDWTWPSDFRQVHVTLYVFFSELNASHGGINVLAGLGCLILFGLTFIVRALSQL